MEKQQKTMLYGFLTMFLGFLSIYMMMPSGFLLSDFLKDLLPDILYYIFIFGLGLVSGIFLCLGLSYGGFQEDEDEIRKKKLFQIYITALVLLTIFSLTITFIQGIENILAYVLMGIFVITSLSNLFYKKFKEAMEKQKESRNLD